MQKLKTIGTHSGTFHCDDALACYLLKLTEAFKNAQIVRTREKEKLKNFDVVVDVGEEYSPRNLKFDHHQKGFMETFNGSSSIKLSSAGLVYKHFGKEIIRDQGCLEKDIDIVYNKVYEGFIKEIDALDNGINQYDVDSKPKYHLNTTLSKRVSYLNPPWNGESSPSILMERFEKAMELTGKEFCDHVKSAINQWLPARNIVIEAVKNRFDIDSSGKIVKFDKFCPWKDHLFDIKETEDVLYVINPGYDDWRVVAVPKTKGSFESKKALRAEWRGLSGEKLVKKSGIDGCIFVHNSGFIGGNKTYEGALKMAKENIKE